MIQFSDEQRAIEAVGEERSTLSAIREKLAHAAIAERKKALLLGPDGETIELPESLFRILRQAADLLSKGARVIVAPIDKELSTQEAADLLNVSRPYLVNLIDRGEIPCEKTGRYRKLRFGDVIAYKEQRSAKRREVLAEMMRKNREAGLYDKPDAGVIETR